jgi:ribonuclease BN (tRNA processing enzyme)
MLSATFYGVRGSTPCSCDGTRQFGGNTSCVLVEIPGEVPIILDLGTGLRYLGRDLLARRELKVANGVGPGPGLEADDQEPFRAVALVSHLHWDHIQGIPFFKPILQADSSLEVIGPRQPGSSLQAELTRFIRPPAFPVGLDQLPGEIRFQDVTDEVLRIGSVQITCFAVPHVGPTNGYRIDAGGASLAYISDHQQPDDGSLDLPADLVASCEGVDILVHDAQFDAVELSQKPDWGHCTADYAAELARRCGARRLVLYHHDPSHDDDWVREVVKRTQDAAGDDIEIIGAAEGLRLVSP